MFHGYFPTTLDEKSTHYALIIPYLNTNKTRLTIASHVDLPLVTTKYNSNFIPDFAAASNAATGNKTNRDDRDADIIYIEKGVVRIYNDIPNSVLTNEDRNTFHIHDPKPASERAKINDSVYVIMNVVGGSRLRFNCRRNTDGGPSSIHEDADCIGFHGAFGNTAPATIADCTLHFNARSAHFTKDMGLDHMGQKFWVFAQYVNLTDESKNGPLSVAFSVTIGG